MKKVLFILMLVILLFGVAANVPPQLPSSFYGEISNYSSGIVCAYSGGLQRACITPFIYSGKWVYAMNVPTEGLAEGTIVRFYIKHELAGIGYIHIGTNVHLDLVAR